MPTPKPPASLDNSCMVIHDNTLYAYTPEAFMSIGLANDAKWEQLEMSVPVAGAACVGSTPSDASQAALYLVGGKGDRTSSGLQKYTYANSNWTTIELADKIAENRRQHGCAMISDALVVYGGNQDNGPNVTTESFTIQKIEPYAVHGYAASGPPTASPLLLSWSESAVAMIAENKLWLFNTDTTWVDSQVTLPPGLDDRASKRLVLITAQDGSKVLVVFNINNSPITVEIIPLQGVKGDLIKEPVAVVGRSVGETARQAKRLSTRDTWPKYNSTFAPESMGPDVAMTAGPDGLIALASKDSLEFFDARENAWRNATAMLGKKQQQVAQFTTSSASTATSSSTSATSSVTRTTSDTMATSSGTGAAAAGQSKQTSSPSSNAILGITLGCILALMALLGIFLLLLRRRKRRRQLPRADGAADEKDSAAFTQDTMPAAPAGGYFLSGHHPKASRESWSPMAILMGRLGKDRPGMSKRLSNGTSRSSVSSLHKMFKSTISKPIPQSATHPVLVGQDERNVAFAPDVATPRPRPRVAPAEARDSTRRSSGWNRYWSGGSALQVLGLGPAKRNTSTSEQSSRYSDLRNPAKVRQDSATVPPLNLDGRPEVSNVVSGSPMVSQFANGVPSEGMAGKIVLSGSRASSGYSSGIPESINEAWDPSEAGGWGAKQAPAPSAYAPGATTGRVPPPSGVSQQPQLAMAATSSDMSWLNLGDQSRR